MSQLSQPEINRSKDWRIVTFAAVSVLLFFAAGEKARAADGDLDPTFGVNGKVVTDFNASTDWLSRIAVQPDGKIVAVGDTHPSHRGALARYNPDGTLDPTFGSGGKVITVSSVRESASGLLLLPDGKIITSGSIDLPSSNDTSFALVRFNSDGSADTTFGNGGTVMTNIGINDDQAYALALQSDGKIVAAGRRGIQFNPTEQRKGNVALARYNPDGSLDTTFGTGGKVINDFGQGLESYAIEVLIQPDGKIVIAGESSYRFLVARYNSDGTLDTTFGNGGHALASFSNNWDRGRDAVLQADGKIIVVGLAIVNSPYDSFAAARFNSDGSLDQTFGNGGKVLLLDRGDLNAAALQSDGKLIALGDDSDSFELLRFNLNGSLDSTFGNGGTVTTTFPGNPAASGSDLVFQADGKLIAGGLASSDIYFHNSDFALARYLDGAPPPPATPSPTPSAAPSATPTPTATPPAATPTVTPVPTATPPAATPTPVPTSTPVATPTPTPEPTATPEASPTPGSTPEPTSTPAPPIPPAQPLNISTRAHVLNGESALIGGFILTGPDSKQVIVRALGPSLGANGMPGALADTVLDLYDSSGHLLASNDNWKDAQQGQIQNTGVAPGDALESAIVVTLSGNSAYTAVVRGKNGGTGIGLVEVYDLGLGSNSKLGNISTRGLIEQGDDVMIGGFIVGGSATERTGVVVRAIGPSLSGLGLSNALSDPTLTLHDSNGSVIGANDNWRDAQQPEITAAGLAPADDREAALFASLAPGAYTAIVAGKANSTGVGLVEAYHVQ